MQFECDCILIFNFSVKVVATSTWKVLAEIQRPKVSNLEFSPKGTYLMTWEPFIGEYRWLFVSIHIEVH